MSPTAGVDYLNTNMRHYLHMPKPLLQHDNFASATAQIFREFSETGTTTWRRKNVEWFLVYLITELGTTPHNIRQGYSIPSLMDAYDAIVHELVNLPYLLPTQPSPALTPHPERTPLRPLATKRNHPPRPRLPRLHRRTHRPR